MQSPPFLRHLVVMAWQGRRRNAASMAWGIKVGASKAGESQRRFGGQGSVTWVRSRLGSSSPQALFDRMNQLAEAPSEFCSVFSGRISLDVGGPGRDRG